MSHLFERHRKVFATENLMKKFLTTTITSIIALALIATGATPAAAEEILIPAELSSGILTVNDNNPAVVYSGTWLQSSTDTRYVEGGAKKLSTTGSATLTFQGSNIRLVSRTAPWLGKAKISLDGGTATTVDLYSSSTVWQKVIYEKKNLAPNTNHTAKITWANSKNLASTGKGIELDAFNILDTTAPSAVQNLKITSTAASAHLTWDANTEPDFMKYAVEKADYGTTTYTVISPKDFKETSLDTFSVQNGKKYRYRVTSYDSSGNTGVKYYDSTFTSPQQPVLRYSNCPTPTVTVSNDTQLRTALAQVKAGDVIKLKDGTYSKFAYNGSFITTEKPSAEKPVWICGSPNTIVNAGTVSTSGNGLSITQANHVNVAGITFTGGHRGINVTYSNNITLTDNTVKKVGLEAIHLMNQTVDSTVSHNTVEDTGLHIGEYGEAVYVGTSEPNWGKYNNGLVDTSDRNRIINNTFTRISGECIDVKRGTKDGIIQGNTCDAGSIGNRDPDAALHSSNWIALRGNSWLVENNTFITTAGNRVNKKVLNGIQVYSNASGYGGLNNIIKGNVSKSWTDTQQYAVMGANPARGNFTSCNNDFHASVRTPYQFGCQN